MFRSADARQAGGRRLGTTNRFKGTGRYCYRHSLDSAITVVYKIRRDMHATQSCVEVKTIVDLEAQFLFS